jgi:hypothetical protein
MLQRIKFVKRTARQGSKPCLVRWFDPPVRPPLCGRFFCLHTSAEIAVYDISARKVDMSIVDNFH